MKIPALLALTAVSLTAVGVLAAPAQAKDVDVKGTTGCTTGIKAKLKAGPRDPGKIKTNVQVDDVGKVRRVWTVTVTDGTQTVTRTATTRGASNSINLDFFTTDNAGADDVTFTATRAGASCSGSVTVP
ncbi:hypothetical protein [Nocardioides sp.]|uniref:hypothetical protein n=1 Tax=Nocardioides sp. TaxID=35761 RepID=UPI003526F969